MNFSLLLSLVFVILIFIEITLQKYKLNNNYRLSIFGIVVVLLIVFEFYTNKDNKKKENFIASEVTQYNIPLNISQNIMHTSDKKDTTVTQTTTQVDLDDDDLYFYDYKPFTFVPINNSIYTLSNKLINNSRLMFIKDLDSNSSYTQHTGNFIDDKYKELLNNKNNKFGAGVCYFSYEKNVLSNKDSLKNGGCGIRKDITGDKECANLILNDNSLIKYSKYMTDNFEAPVDVSENSRIKCIKNRCTELEEALFIAGGYSNTDKFSLSNEISICDLSTNTWFYRNFPSGELKFNVEPIIYKDKVMFIGGIFFNTNTNKLDYSRKIEIYDYSKGRYTDSDCWSVKELDAGVTNSKCIIVDNKLLCVGGFNNDGYYNKIQKVDLTDFSITKTQLPSDIIHENIAVASLNDMAVLMSGKVYENTLSLDRGLKILFKNNLIYKKIDNILISIPKFDDSDTIVSETFDDNNYLTPLINSDEFTISITLKCLDISVKNKVQWILGQDNTKDTLGLCLINYKVYPVYYNNKYKNLYIYTDGITIQKDVVKNITIVFNKEEDSYIYSNYNVNDKETFNLDQLDKLSSKFPNVEIEDINIDERKYANIEIIDYKAYDIRLNDATIINQFIKNFSYLNGVNKNINYSSAFIYKNGSINKNTYKTYTNTLPFNEELIYNVVANSYNNKYAIFLANVKENNKLKRKMLIFNKHNNLWETEKTILDDTNTITLVTKKLGDKIIFGGITNKDNMISASLDVIKFTEEVSDNTTEITMGSDIKTTESIVFGNKINKYFKGYMCNININSSTDTIDNRVEFNKNSFDNIYIIVDSVTNNIKSVMNNIDKIEKIRFLNDRKALYFNGINSSLFVPNINSDDFNISLWIFRETEENETLAFSLSGNWELHIKNNHLYLNDNNISDSPINSNKWVFIDIDISRQNSIITGGLETDLEKAIDKEKVLNKYTYKCRKGQEFVDINGKKQCKDCEVDYYGDIIEFTEEEVDDDIDVNNKFKCFKCPPGKTTFNRKGKSECYAANFFQKRTIPISENGYKKLANSIDSYNKQKEDLYNQNYRISKSFDNIMRSCNFTPRGESLEQCKELCKLDNLVACDMFCDNICQNCDDANNCKWLN